MGIFNRIFRNDTESKPQTVSFADTKVKESIYDFFKINLEELPNDTFVESETILSKTGESIQHFQASIDYLECDIFDTIEIHKFQNGSMNISFKYYNLSKVKINDVIKLINSLYLIYGDDDSNKGKFTDNDLNDFNSDESSIFFGRYWTNDKYEIPVFINIDRESSSISLSLWGIKHK